MSYMKIVTVREVSRHFTRHAQCSLQGETVRVFREGKPYVRIVPDEEVETRPVPKIDFAARAREDFPEGTLRSDIVSQIIRNRR
jgi:antitoxin (DNA-binding transcriptional repressor) of toxin-antitoxin stability system